MGLHLALLVLVMLHVLERLHVLWMVACRLLLEVVLVHHLEALVWLVLLREPLASELLLVLKSLLYRVVLLVYHVVLELLLLVHHLSLVGHLVPVLELRIGLLHLLVHALHLVHLASVLEVLLLGQQLLHEK